MRRLTQSKTKYKIHNGYEWTLVLDLIHKGYKPWQAVLIALGTGNRPGLQVEETV